jgi:excinuclease ABC subunit B
MRKTIESTNYRRDKQAEYNQKHGVTPQPIIKASREIIGNEERKTRKAEKGYKNRPKAYIEKDTIDIAADPVVQYMDRHALEQAIENTKKQM